MKTIIVDYSKAIDAKTPVAGDQSGSSGKFVQIRHEDSEYIVFAPKETAPYHADIIEKFCAEMGIDGFLDKQEKRFEIHDPAWDIVGGGKFEMDRQGLYVRLYDNSMAYGKFERDGMEDKLRGTEEFAGYEIRVE
ncbi:MAG: hypothetical protein EPN22_05695 [Nitrospirae bacterium]|nr:MAG: hypothetical protein EPN22_05695 [Nitrospirota bacterium]